MLRLAAFVVIAAIEFAAGTAVGAYTVNRALSGSKQPSAQLCYKIWRSGAVPDRWPACMDQPIADKTT